MPKEMPDELPSCMAASRKRGTSALSSVGPLSCGHVATFSLFGDVFLAVHGPYDGLNIFWAVQVTLHSLGRMQADHIQAQTSDRALQEGACARAST